MKSITLNLALLVVLTLCLSARQAMAYTRSSLNILVDGRSRNIILYTPDNIEKNLPLMIVTHGMNQSPEYQSEADKLYELIDKERFVVAYLRSIGNTWDISGTSDQKFVEQTIGEMYAKYAIDPHRVYWSGFSMGSMLMYHSMHNMTGRIAAFAPCSGIQFSEQPWTKVRGPINLIHCHAKDDSVFPLNNYDVHSYVQNMAAVNGENTYTKETNYIPFSGATPGDKQVWTNAQGYKVELFLYNWGDHNPSHNNAVELWNFCKQCRLETIDAIPEPEKPSSYSVSETDEKHGDADNLNGLTLFPTDADLTAIWYVNPAIEGPQNLRSGSYNDISVNEFCWLKFKRVTDAQCTTSGNLYTIQMANSSGSNYTLWGCDGYLNTPPGAWCLFALGLTHEGVFKYGQDGPNTGLWRVDYEDGKGYVIQNVGTLESGANSYVSPAYGVPQAAKCYVRLFTKLTKTDTGISDISVSQPATHKTYDLLGRCVTELSRGSIYICNGRKYIQR